MTSYDERIQAWQDHFAERDRRASDKTYGGRLKHRDGVPWWEARKPFVLHRHRWQTRHVEEGVYRCACGAIDDGSGWTFIPPDRPRRRWLP